jgi:hypothetical protein
MHLLVVVGVVRHYIVLSYSASLIGENSTAEEARRHYKGHISHFV